jgi:hypothetical protein
MEAPSESSLPIIRRKNMWESRMKVSINEKGPPEYRRAFIFS